MSEEDELVEGALNEGGPEGQPASREEPPSPKEPGLETTAEVQPEPDAEAGETAPGVTTTQPPPAATEPEKPNAFVPREALDAVREQARIYKELYEETQGKAEPEPEEEPEFFTVLEEELWHKNKILEDRVTKNEAALEDVLTERQVAQAVAESVREFHATVAELQDLTGLSFTDDQKATLMQEAATLGRQHWEAEHKDLPVNVAVYRAHLQMQAAATAKSDPASPKPGSNGAEALARIAAEKEGLNRPPKTAPPPGGKPVDEKLTAAEAIRRAVAELKHT